MIGQRLAHYEITAKLGEGGMGEEQPASCADPVRDHPKYNELVRDLG